MENTQEIYGADMPTNTVFDKTIKYLQEKYEIRFNEISLEYEISLINQERWEILNLNSLFIELTQADVGISIRKLEILIRSHLIKKYNPIKKYFEKLKWDGKDHIRELSSFIRTDNDKAFSYHFEKWFTRAVKCIFIKGYVNKQCLVFTNTVQNSGKTTFLRFLTPPSLERYYTENISVDKDGQIALCKNIILNADELAVLSKSDINALKSFISKANVNVRLPYGRKAELMNRICSFIGSTNRSSFLQDETGSVRWLVFEIYNIDFGYSKLNIDNIWAQAYYNAFKRKDFNSELTSLDIKENEQRNERFTQLSEEQEILSVYFEKSEDVDDFKTASEVARRIKANFGVQVNNIKIGRALTGLHFKRIKHAKFQVYGYLIKLK